MDSLTELYALLVFIEVAKEDTDEFVIRMINKYHHNLNNIFQVLN